MKQYWMHGMILGLALGPVLGCKSYSPNEREVQALADEESENAVRTTIAAFKLANPGLEKYFEESHGYVVFPTVVKGGMVMGATFGTGRVYEKGEFIGMARITQLSFGATFGGQRFREVIFFEDERTLGNFKQSKIEFGAGAAAVAFNRATSKDAAYERGVAVFTMSAGGMMVDASVSQQKFKFEPK